MKTKICSKCKKELPATKKHFYKGSRFKDGLSTRCKECLKETQKEINNNYEEVEGKTKICSKCKKEYPATIEFFDRNSRGKDGLHTQCKECRKEIRKMHHKKLKEKGLSQQHYKENKLKYIVSNMNKRTNPQITVEELENRINEFKDSRNKLHCVYCNRIIKDDAMLHIEHFVPVSKGGTNDMNNIIPVCRYCNRSKEDEDFIYWYRNQLFYSPAREKKILKLLNCTENEQLTIAI